jgi:type I restriction enzyme S subunit
LAYFIEIAANVGTSRAFIEENLFTTAGQWGISGQNLKYTPIPICNAAEQELIVSEVFARLTASEKLDMTLDHQLARSMSMRQSLLEQAFSGELVDPERSGQDGFTTLALIQHSKEQQARAYKIGKAGSRKMVNARTRARARRPLLDVLKEQKKPITPEQLFRDARFDPSQVDEFYRELKSIVSLIVEEKPVRAAAKSWPQKPSVLLRIKRDRS